ncbi:YfbM family protein [Paenibacillus sp. YPG26]|uniref:YfbM family protein n=1 Tax=Paenibacillus sp. YPG26 TaxID=2878915 RepID=UPI00203DD2CB|nr:YfbM family protein [Paenibacillus sp. YPG26]USB32988.1 YfbM family protein [Paenibacillus sp. YPG26]
MSMIGNLKQISEETLDLIIKGEVDPEAVVFDEEDEGLDLDKSWHAIHFLLNGSAWEGEAPLFNVILGGKEVGEDLGYGKTRYLTNKEVQEVTLTLVNITEEDLKQRFDAAVMNELEIYPFDDWSGDEEMDYVLSYYTDLKEYYMEAVRQGNAMLLFIS